MATTESEKPPLRVALYLRVSTAEQTIEPQRQELLEYGKQRAWDWTEYSDQISGAKFTRVGLDRMMKAVRKKEVDAIACVKLDRLGRSMIHIMQLIAELDKWKVGLICPSQGIDTSRDNPAARLQLNILAAFTQFERSLIIERTKAGLDAARARGSKIGRPKTGEEEIAKVRECLARTPRPSMRAISAETGVSLGKVAAVAKDLD